MKSRFVIATWFVSLLLLVGCFSNLETDKPLALSTPPITTFPSSTAGMSSPEPAKTSTSLPQPTDEPIVSTRSTTPTTTITAPPIAVLQGNSWSSHPSLSGNGRFVAFVSNASNLVSGDSNNVSDVFTRDRQLGITERISVSSNGAEANGASTQASISADGNLVAFSSDADNLVEGDTNNASDIFVRDRKAGVTERVSIASNGEQSNGVFSHSPAISADGRYVVFVSDASNLVTGVSPTGNHIFIHDRNTRETTQVDVNDESVSAKENSLWPSISTDGRFIAFTSWATNLITGTSAETSARIYVHDRQTNKTELIGGGITPSISPDGRYVAFLRQSEGDEDIFLFVYNRETEEQKQISWIVGGIHGQPDANEIKISADGRWITFWGVDRNEATGEEKSYTDIFLYDQESNTVEMVSQNSVGVPANSGSGHPDISTDGRWIVFHSRADNLVDKDMNNETDVFIRDRETGQTELVSVISP